MRIISGSLGGRIFQPPKSNRTHPMSERVRGAIFNALLNVEGKTCLDAFAGSGALGFEFISRGGEFATLIDKDKNAAQSMKNAAKELGIEEKCKITQANVYSWSGNNKSTVFDIVFTDPPYDKFQNEKLEKLIRHVKLGGYLVVSLPGKYEVPEIPSLKLESYKNYGDASVVFYVKN